MPVENSSRNNTGRAREKRFGDLQATTLSATQVDGFGIGQIRDVEPFQNFHDALWQRFEIEALEAAVGQKIVAHAEKEFDGGFLQHAGDAAAHFERLTRDITAEHARRAGGGAQQRGENFEERGLAGAVWAEQAEDRALGHAEAHSVHGAHGRQAARMEDLCQILDFDCVFAHATAAPRAGIVIGGGGGNSVGTHTPPPVVI